MTFPLKDVLGHQLQLFGVYICSSVAVRCSRLGQDVTSDDKEYKVGYADKTSDYLSFHDFDGVEVILEPDCWQ